MESNEFSSTSSFSTRTPTPYTSIGRPDYTKYITSLLVISIILLGSIVVFHNCIQPKLSYCQTGSASLFCKKCPSNAKCNAKENNFVCVDNSYIKFDSICHKPGKYITSDDKEKLEKLQRRIYSNVTQFGYKRIFYPVRINNFVDDKRNEDDIVIAWTYNEKGKIDGDGHLILNKYDLDIYGIAVSILLIIFVIIFLN